MAMLEMGSYHIGELSVSIQELQLFSQTLHFLILFFSIRLLILFLYAAKSGPSGESKARNRVSGYCSRARVLVRSASIHRDSICHIDKAMDAFTPQYFLAGELS